MSRLLLALVLLLPSQAVMSPQAASAEASVIVGFDNESVNGAWSGPGAEDGFAYARLSGGLWLQAGDAASTGGNPAPHMQGLLGSKGGRFAIVRAGGGRFTFDGADVARIFVRPGVGQAVIFQGLAGGRPVGTDRFATAPATNAWTSHASAALSGLVLDELRVTLEAEGVTATQAVDNIVLTPVDSVSWRRRAAPVAIARAGVSGRRR